MKALDKVDFSNETQHLISVCKSDSGVMGIRLREAHRRLGNKVAEMIRGEYQDAEFTVISLMRSGCSFGEGIADILDCPLLHLDEKHDSRWRSDASNPFIEEYLDFLSGSTVVLADAVIHTGNTIKSVYDVIDKISLKTIIASNVVQKDYNPEGRESFCVRVSDNKFVGERMSIQCGNRGPDTGDRLYRTLVLRDSCPSHTIAGSTWHNGNRACDDVENIDICEKR